MNLNGKKIIVTGGAGFIGSHLVGALLGHETKVVVIDNFSSGKMVNLGEYAKDKNLTIIKTDILHKEKLTALFKKADFVYHLATQCLRVSLNNPQLVHAVNSTGALNVCQAALASRAKRLIYVSSSEVYGSAKAVPMSESHPCAPTTIYGASKLTGELYAQAFLKTSGLAVIIVRPFNTYGPRAHFEGAYGEVIPKFTLRALNNKAPVIFGDGRQTRDFTYVSDVVRGILLASQCDGLIGSAVNIAFGREVSINTIARLVLEATEKNSLRPQRGKPRPADVRRHYADISLAKTKLGYRPQVAIEEGITEYVRWVKENVNLVSGIKQEKLYNW
ncbi:MAG: NAD-dependent epimerase/dehydratase family protein [Candidatus Omnitrophota bacterium]